jgi:nicotinate-nucleotide adenylyltransferase
VPARRPAVYGFLGGSFDPVHKSHIALARAALKERGLRVVYLVPAARSPFKDGPPRASAVDRLAMLRRAVRGVPGLRIGDWEIHRPGPSYTFATLRRLRRAFPGRRWEVLLGEDAWSGFRGWRRWREIARRHPLVVAPRTGSRPVSLAGVHFLKARLGPLSSTAARAAIAQNGPWRGMVPEGAARVIEKRRLYRGPEALPPPQAFALRRLLTGERWRHSEAVALWARALAQRHGVDPERAERAGWWHDVAKNWSPGRLRDYARRKKIPIPWGGAKALDPLLHGPVGARWARDRGFLTDPAALAAIARHTVGARRMSRLDKILYVADFSSPDRRYPEAARVRRWAVKDLDRALREALRAKLLHTLERGRIVMHTSVGLWNQLLSESR